MARILIILTLALGPLQWISVSDLNTLALKPVHLPFFAAAGLGWLALLRGQVLAHVVRPALLFAVPLFCYLLLLMMTVVYLGGKSPPVMKYTFYFFGICGWFFALATMERRKALDAVLWGGIAASFLFFAVAFLTLHSKGINLFAIILRALSTGDTGILQFMLFRNLFNETAAMTEDSIGTALRHSALGFIFISLIVCLACWNRNHMAKAGAILSILIILIGVSRSQWLAVMLALSPVILRTLVGRPGLGLAAACVAGLALGWLAVSVDLSGVGAIFEQRFGSLGDDGRLSMYSTAFQYIDAQPLIGYGAGQEIDYGGRRMVQVHNIFLGAWVQAGLLGFIAAIGFTGALIWLYTTSVVRSFGAVSAERLCLTGLVILPLFRSQISGSGGNYTMPEWICIALFLALAVPHRKQDGPREDWKPIVPPGGYYGPPQPGGRSPV